MKTKIAWSALMLLSMTSASYKQRIDQFSFDTAYGEYPLAYQQFGASVGLKTKMKLVPAARPTYGAIFLNQPVQSTDFEALFDVDIRNKRAYVGTQDNEPEGFCVWYLHYKPTFPFDFGETFGFQAQTNGVGVCVVRSRDTDGQWRVMSQSNNGIDSMTPESLTRSYAEGKNGCSLNDFLGGKLELSFRVTQGQFLDVATGYNNQGNLRPCIQRLRYEGYLNFQGFFGITAMNKEAVRNDIDLKMIEFFNLNAQYYQEREGLEKRNYFHADQIFNHMAETAIEGKTLTGDLGATAHDLLSMRRRAAKQQKEEVENDLSNMKPNDSFEETVFKLFEQVKAYNNRLSEFNKRQKDLLRDLKQAELTMQRESHYIKLKEELAFAETGVEEVEAKLQNLLTDLGRTADQVQQVLYMKQQVKLEAVHPVEYLMPQPINDAMSRVQRSVTALEQQMQGFLKAKSDTANKLQSFLRELIQFEQQKSSSVELNSFSISVSKRFDERMTNYETMVHNNVQRKNWTQGALITVACLSVFLVWAKVKALKRKYLL